MPDAPINMFGGSPLNRLSWLRPSQTFLNAIVAVPSTRWILFNAGQPLMVSSDDGLVKPTPAYLSTNDVRPLLGSEPFFGQGQYVGDLAVEKDGEHDHPQHSPTEGARHLGVRAVFLGLHENREEGDNGALPSSDFNDPVAAIEKLKGTPYFSADVSDLNLPPEELQNILNQTSQGQDRKTLSWSEPRSLMSGLDPFTAAVFASARSMADWNIRNKFCAGCGSATYSMWGGWKIGCTSLLPWADNSNRKPCPTTKGLHNFTHPRTDAVVIMIAIDETGDKVLLGRGRKFPGKFYSALAGFIEPAESFEDAVAREMWEEAGVRVWNVTYHSGQPWPYPANLMVGFYARADSTKPIRTDLDNELVDARWFTREEVKAVLDHKTGTHFNREENRKMTDYTEGRPNTTQEQNVKLEPAAQALTPAEITSTKAKEIENIANDDPPFRLPPITAIAGVLIRDWVDGKIGFRNEADAPSSKETIQKGHL